MPKWTPPHPDRTDRCCWPGCTTPHSLRYRVPMCDVHVRMAYQQVRAVDEAEDLAARQSRALDRFSHETIYYLSLGDQIKIGYTVDLDQRMRSYPPASILLATHPGTLADETALHERFKAYRASGREWYHRVPDLLTHIATHRQEPRPARGAPQRKTEPTVRVRRSANRERRPIVGP